MGHGPHFANVATAIFAPQAQRSNLWIYYVDTDFANDLSSRKSTTGFVPVSQHLIIIFWCSYYGFPIVLEAVNIIP